MRRIFAMKLKPGNANEYRKRHEQIWPEMFSALKEAGISEYTIALDERTWTLFAIQTINDPERIASLWRNESFIRWQKYMSDIIEPETIPLQEMFHFG